MRTSLTLRLSVLVVGSLLVAIGSGCGGNGPAGPTAIPTATFSGRVTESAPTQSTPVGGAQLKVLSGVRTGATSTADADGNFSLGDVSAAFDVLVQADGYEDATIHVDSSTGATRRTIGLMPKLRTITETVGVPGGSRRPPTSLFRNVHHAGLIVVSGLSFTFFGDDTNPVTRTVEIWEGGRLIGAGTINRGKLGGVDLSLRVAGGARYEIRITGGEWSSVTIESPN